MSESLVTAGFICCFEGQFVIYVIRRRNLWDVGLLLI